MRLLLDAHVVIWFLSNPGRLRPTTIEKIQSPDTEIFVSTASLLEITAKAATGRLIFDDEMRADIEAISTWVPVAAEHALRVQTLPPIHKDPFDRVVVAQALIEQMILVTSDRILGDYHVPILLA